MIHTAKFYCTIDEQELSSLTRKFNENVSLLSKKIDINYKWVATTFRNQYSVWYLYLNIDFIELLGNANISEHDFTTVEQEINTFLFHLFGNNSKELTLIRLDFRFDTVVENAKHREFLLKVYRKTFATYGFKKKYDQYKSSIYFNSKSMNVIAYDKEAERKAKLTAPEAYEVDVLRFEVRLLNKHINYMKRQYGIAKTLQNYMTDDTWKDYFFKHTCPFFFPGNFYKINMAEKQIANSNLKQREKDSLREFICNVSNYGFEGIKTLEKTTISGKKMPKYTKYLINKHLLWLKEINVNPLLIPKNLKIELGPQKCILNPLASILSA